MLSSSTCFILIVSTTIHRVYKGKLTQNGRTWFLWCKVQIIIWMVVEILVGLEGEEKNTIRVAFNCRENFVKNVFQK